MFIIKVMSYNAIKYNYLTLKKYPFLLQIKTLILTVLVSFAVKCNNHIYPLECNGGNAINGYIPDGTFITSSEFASGKRQLSEDPLLIRFISSLF